MCLMVFYIKSTCLFAKKKKISIYAVFTFYSFWTVILYSRTMFKLSLMELVYQEFFTFWFCANIFLILVICRKIVAHKVCYILFLLSEWLEKWRKETEQSSIFIVTVSYSAAYNSYHLYPPDTNDGTLNCEVKEPSLSEIAFLRIFYHRNGAMGKKTKNNLNLSKEEAFFVLVLIHATICACKTCWLQLQVVLMASDAASSEL